MSHLEELARNRKNTSSLFEKYHLKNSSSSENQKHISVIKYESVRNMSVKYDSEIMVIRRGTSFKLHHMQLDANILLRKDISIELITVSSDGLFSIKLSDDDSQKVGFTFTMKDKEIKNYFVITITSDLNTSIGLYSLCLLQKNQRITQYMGFYLVFNPFHELDSVYCSQTRLINEYLLSQNIKIYSGDEKSHHPVYYNLDQFSTSCILVCGEFISRMKFEDRNDPALVSRAFTALVNGNDDNGLILGCWGKIKDGKNPSVWKNALEIYKEYLNTKKPVRWAQCFVFAMLYNSMIRNVGMLCRVVTGFSIGHDENLDGYLTLIIDSETLKNVEQSETLWNFHCWNNAYFKRKDVEFGHNIENSSISCWQHLDGTPQEKSQGIYQCGPYPIELLRKGVHNKIVPYDASLIYYSMNCITRYIIIGKDKKKVNEYEKNNAAKLIVTTDINGKKIDITNEYKPTKKTKPITIKEKTILTLDVAETAKIGDLMEYKINIKNATAGSSTIICLTLEIHDKFGKNILDSHLYQKVFVFDDSDANFHGKIESFRVQTKEDFSMLGYHWDLRFHDPSKKKFKNVIKNTTIFPSMIASINISRKPSTSTNEWEVVLHIKNEFPFDLEDCAFRFTHNRFDLLKIIKVQNFLQNSEKSFTFDIEIINRGIHTFEVLIESKYCNATLSKKKLVF